jgi:cobalt-zinc-cadmium efflux system membrane fusion protein
MFPLHKVFAFLLSLSLILSGCQDEATQTAPEGSDELSTAYIHLSAEQKQMAGIETGQAKERPLANSIGCTAYVDVPPYSLASVYTPVAGVVQGVKHLPGEYVQKGSLLTRITHPNIIQLQQDFLEINSQLDFLRQDATRQQTLSEAEAASTRRYQEAQAQLAQAEARSKGLGAQLQLLGIDAQQLAEGGEVQTAISLRAPISGYLTQVNVNQGKLVGPDELLYELVDNNHKHLELNVFAKDLPQLREGQRILAYVPGNEQAYEAEVHLIGKQIDETNKTVRVHGHFTEEPQELLTGTYLQARIFTDDRQAWSVPETAVVRRGETATVYASTPEGFLPIAVDVEPGRDSFVVIRNYEAIAGKELVLKGAYYLQDSMEGSHGH